MNISISRKIATCLDSPDGDQPRFMNSERKVNILMVDDEPANLTALAAIGIWAGARTYRRRLYV